TNNASRVLGPTASGVLLAHLGIQSVFWLASILYVLSLGAALKVHMRSRPAASHPDSLFASIRQGLVWVRGDRRMIGVLLITVYFNVFGWPYTSMIPVIGTGLQLGPEGVGMLASSEGIGGLAGALLMASVARVHWYGRIYVGAVAAYFVM